MKLRDFRQIREGMERGERKVQVFYGAILSLTNIKSGITSKEDLRRYLLGSLLAYSKWLQKPENGFEYRSPYFAPESTGDQVWIDEDHDYVNLAIPDRYNIWRNLVRIQQWKYDGTIKVWAL